ncbi:halo transducer protein [Halopiger thermotolerans]
MDEYERGENRTDLDGLSLEAAVDAVDDESADDGAVRETLAVVADDGVVRRAAVDDALANASKVVTTAETRAELAATAMDDARDAAAGVSEMDVVATRLEEFASRLETVEDRAAGLGERLQSILDRKGDGDLYDLAREIRGMTAAATEVQRAADDLQFELESFEAWLEDPDRRVAELTDDVDALEQSLDDLEGVVDGLAAEADLEDGDDPAVAWAQASIQHCVAELMLADLRAELATLREWADREDADRPSGVGPRLDDLAARHDATGERLAERAEPAWRERFGDQVAALEEAFGELEPPVAWDAVESVVEEHRPGDE